MTKIEKLKYYKITESKVDDLYDVVSKDTGMTMYEEIDLDTACKVALMLNKSRELT